MERLTAEQVIERAGLIPDLMYMQTDSGNVALGEEWAEVIREAESLGYADIDSMFDPDGDGAHLVEVVRDNSGKWVEA